MIRTTLQYNYIKRTVRPLYGWTQATPKAGFLDPTWGRPVQIYPGMVMTKTVGMNFTLIGATGANAPTGMAAPAAQVPAGLCAHFLGGYGIDELLDAGVNFMAVWELSPDAEFEILAPAFDTTQTWVDNPGADSLVYASTAGANQGQLVPAGAANASTNPVARLIQVESSTSIIIGGLKVRQGGVIPT